MYLTLFLSLISPVSTILRRASNRSFVKCFVSKSVKLEIRGSRFNVSHYILNPQKSDVYVSQHSIPTHMKVPSNVTDKISYISASAILVAINVCFRESV